MTEASAPNSPSAPANAATSNAGPAEIPLRTDFGPMIRAAVLCAAAGAATAAAGRTADSVLGPDPATRPTVAATAAALFGLGAAILSVWRRPSAGRGSATVPAVLAVAAAGLLGAADLWAARLPDLYAELRRFTEPAPAAIALCKAAITAIAAPGLLLLGAAWAAGARTMPARPSGKIGLAAGAGFLVASIAGAAAGWAVAHFALLPIWPVSAIGMAVALLALLSALPTLMAPGGADPAPAAVPAPEPASTTADAGGAAAAPATPAPVSRGGLMDGIALATMGLVAAAGLFVWSLANREPAVGASRFARIHRLFGEAPVLAAAFLLTFAAVRLVSGSVWLRSLVPLVAWAAAGAWVLSAPPYAPASISQEVPPEAQTAVEALLEDWPGASAQMLAVNWDVPRLPMLPERRKPDSIAQYWPLPQIDWVRPDLPPETRPRRYTAGLTTALPMSPADAVRGLPGRYEIVLIGAPPADADVRQWISVEHFERCRRLTAGTLIQVLPPLAADDMARTVAGMKSAFGDQCWILMALRKGGHTPIVVAGAIPKPSAPGSSRPRDDFEDRGLIVGLTRWTGIWCAPSPKDTAAPIREIAPR